MSAITITTENYQNEVVQSDRPVLLDFWASWCTPCKMLAPIIDEIAADHPEIKVGKVNVDEEKALADKFKIMGVPSLFVMRGGEIASQSVGAKTKGQILDMFLS